MSAVVQAKPIRIMIDEETMSMNRHNAGILTLGAVEFDEHNPCKSTFYGRADPQKTEAMGFHVDPAVMGWWNEQDTKIRAEAFGGTVPLDDVLVRFQDWVDKIIDLRNADLMNGHFYTFNDVELWGKGSDFDAPILESAHYYLFGTWPFDFRKYRCYRTLKSLISESRMDWLKAQYGPVEKHNALADAKFQAYVASDILADIACTAIY